MKSERGDGERAFLAGAHGILSKSNASEDLLRVVKELLASKEASSGRPKCRELTRVAESVAQSNHVVGVGPDAP
jgi:DNA-binding NarL/FixJ family response regulator